MPIDFGSIPSQTLTGRIIYTKQFYLNWSYLPISHCIQFDSKGYEKPKQQHVFAIHFTECMYICT